MLCLESISAALSQQQGGSQGCKYQHRAYSRHRRVSRLRQGMTGLFRGCRGRSGFRGRSGLGSVQDHVRIHDGRVPAQLLGRTAPTQQHKAAGVSMAVVALDNGAAGA